MILDYHMHLVDDDEPYTETAFTLGHAERYADAAAAAGVDEIAFTDHAHRFRQARGWSDHPLWLGGATEDLDRYHEAAGAARDAGLPVKVGIEVDHRAGGEHEIAAVLDAYEWDVVLGSVHWVAGHAVDWDADSVWEHLPADDVWERYTDTLCQAAATGLYDVMAHPDLAKVFGHRPGPERDRLYDRIAAAFAAAGVSAEVSTAGYRRALGELYPDPALLARFRENGVPVTLASDAHAPEGIGRDFARALDEVRRAGYTTLTRFDRRRPTQVAIDG